MGTVLEEKKGLIIPEELLLEFIAWGYLFLFRKTDMKFFSLDKVKIGINKKNKNGFYVSDGINSEIFMDYDLFKFLKEQEGKLSNKIGKVLLFSEGSFSWFEGNKDRLIITDGKKEREFNENEKKRINFAFSKSIIMSSHRGLSFKGIRFRQSDKEGFLYNVQWEGKVYKITNKDALKIVVLTGGIFN